MPKGYGHLDVRENDRHVWIATPTIQKLRIALDGLAEAGAPVDAPLMISQLVNAPSVFAVRELGQASADAEAEAEAWARRIGADG